MFNEGTAFTLSSVQDIPFSTSSAIYSEETAFTLSAVQDIGSLAAPTRSHLIGDHPSGLTKEQTRETIEFCVLALFGHSRALRIHPPF